MPKKKTKKKPIEVYIAVPTGGNLIHVQLASKLVQIAIDCIKRKNYEPQIAFSNMTGIDHNRNLIVRNFLKTKAKWLLTIDHDNPPLNNPLNLIEFNKDIMCLPTMMWRGVGGSDGNEGLAFNVYKKIKGGYKTFVYDGKNKLFQADRVGTGCLLMKRSAILKLKDNAPFASVINKKTGERVQGEDIAFSDKARKAGLKLWGHWDYSCSHYKEVDLLDVAQLLIKAKDKGVPLDKLTPLINTKR